MSYVAEGVLPLFLQSQASMSLVGSIILLLAGRASQVQYPDSLDSLKGIVTYNTCTSRTPPKMAKS